MSSQQKSKAEPHPSHEIYDDGWFVYDPMCCHCRHGPDCPEIAWPCESQPPLFKDLPYARKKEDAG